MDVSYLELVLQQVFLVRKLAVKAKKLLLLLTERLMLLVLKYAWTRGAVVETHIDVYLVLLKRIHVR